MSMNKNNCETCPVHNAGKSTVFNNLTGLKQHTGNWPGKTVTRAEGGFEYNNSRYKLVDLPGTYSLLSTSTDEEVARDFILFGQPDVTVVVADATRIERNLNLVLQILEITDRAILCLNLMDEAERHKIKIDDRMLSKDLGIPVISTVARYNKGMSELLNAIDEIVTGKFVCKPYRIKSKSRELNFAVEKLSKKILEEFPALPNVKWVALRLLEGDQSIIDSIRNGDLGKIYSDNQKKLELEGAV